MLLDAGFDSASARFARTLTLEDLLVQAADTLWKGKRDERLEAAVVRHFGEPACHTCG